MNCACIYMQCAGNKTHVQKYSSNYFHYTIASNNVEKMKKNTEGVNLADILVSLDIHI